ncbi:MAG: hypothetical protein CBC48_20625 [bacterium TMED88]|nr:hypothetical protein [Deltaproteobacteria bacterium]OUV21262.1 MAG: hypothetical protein CBC48_20625 [bacterium TMED88]
MQIHQSKTNQILTKQLTTLTILHILTATNWLYVGKTEALKVTLRAIQDSNGKQGAWMYR